MLTPGKAAVHDVQRMGDAKCGGWCLHRIPAIWEEYERVQGDGLPLSRSRYMSWTVTPGDGHQDGGR
jgi:hypothetical protein